MEINFNGMPDLFRHTQFYDSLDKNNNNSFFVPINCFKTNFEINSKNDFEEFVQTLLFWGFKIYPTLSLKSIEYIVCRREIIKLYLDELGPSGKILKNEIFNFLNIDFDAIFITVNQLFEKCSRDMEKIYSIKITKNQLFKIRRWDLFFRMVLGQGPAYTPGR